MHYYLLKLKIYIGMEAKNLAIFKLDFELVLSVSRDNDLVTDRIIN